MGVKLSILIVEPSEVVVEGLKAMLDGEKDFHLLSPLHDAEGLAGRIGAMAPDMLLINPTVSGCMDRRQLAELRQHRPAMPVVAIVYQYVDSAMLAAFDAQLDIRLHRSEVVALLRSQSQRVVSVPNAAGEAESYELSERETDVLILVAQGLSSKVIADRLHISVHTVNSHRKNITHKTGIKSVAGLAMYAMLHNLTN